MRVLMYSWEYPPYLAGGLGKHVMELLPALDRQGMEVHLLTPDWAGDALPESMGNVVVHPVAVAAQVSGNIHDTAWRANRDLTRHAEDLWSDVGDFDIIHAHDWLVAFSACEVKQHTQASLVSTMHATERGRGGGHLAGEMAGAIHSTEQWLVAQSDRVIVTSHYMAQQIGEHLCVPLDKVDVVPNGVDATRFERHGAEDLVGFRRRYATPEQKLVFSVGRVEYQKGLHTLVEAVPLVLSECPQARFVIAGRGSQLASLRRRVAELGLGSKVLFPGYISDVERDRLYEVSDAAIFPSLYEPFGIVALEAMAARCPVIVSEVGGLQEVVRCGETGLTVHPDDPASLSWGILKALAEPEQAQARAAAAYQVVRQEYNWDRIATLTVASYYRAQRESM